MSYSLYGHTTLQNKIAVLNLCPNIHVPDNSENKNVDQELSGNKQLFLSLNNAEILILASLTMGVSMQINCFL
jgi:hypothetical protein